MDVNPHPESCLLTHQGCSLVCQVGLTARYCRIVTAYYQCSPRVRGALLSMCHGNVDVIVQADWHHQGIKQVITVWPSADDAQIHVDFCRGSALQGTHTLALVIRLSLDLLVRIIVCFLSDRYTAPNLSLALQSQLW